MKKKIAILSLFAIFASTTALTAQTATVKKGTCNAKTEVKAETAACCKEKTAAECKTMTAEQKAKCTKGAKTTAQAGTDKVCSKSVENKTTVVATN